jgi:hypothetical protein
VTKDSTRVSPLSSLNNLSLWVHGGIVPLILPEPAQVS